MKSFFDKLSDGMTTIGDFTRLDKVLLMAADKSIEIHKENLLKKE